RIVRRVRVESPMDRVEPRAKSLDVSGPPHLELVVLAHVADIDAPPHVDRPGPVALGQKRRPKRVHEGSKARIELGGREPVERPAVRLYVIVAAPGHAP